MNKYQIKWDNRSSIRTSPRKIIDFHAQGYFFPPDKQPLLLLPQIQALGEEIKKRLLIQTFYKYLEDIVNLEAKSIISACNLIINKDLPIDYDLNIKLNAYTIIIDEYYHIYLAQDMINQLKQQFLHIPRLSYPISDAYKAIQTIKDQLKPLYHDLFEIIAVCIFETTLVRELVEFFNSVEVHPSVKYYIHDHMNDEAKHNGYFFEVLCHTWESLPAKFKDVIGSYLGDFIILYLNITSDKQFNQMLASSLLSNEKQAQTLIEQLYKGFTISANLPIVKNVLNVLDKAKLTTNAKVRAGLLKHNLYQ